MDLNKARPSGMHLCEEDTDDIDRVYEILSILTNQRGHHFDHEGLSWKFPAPLHRVSRSASARLCFVGFKTAILQLLILEMRHLFIETEQALWRDVTHCCCCCCCCSSDSYSFAVFYLFVCLFCVTEARFDSQAFVCFLTSCFKACLSRKEWRNVTWALLFTCWGFTRVPARLHLTCRQTRRRLWMFSLIVHDTVHGEIGGWEREKEGNRECNRWISRWISMLWEIHSPDIQADGTFFYWIEIKKVREWQEGKEGERERANDGWESNRWRERWKERQAADVGDVVLWLPPCRAA